ncbi:unnamed protein product [Brassica oleracea]
MLVQRRVMRWKIIWKSFQAVSANGFIFSFTLLLALKLDHLLSHSWWFVFTPLWWLCHAIISRGRCSLPSPPMPHDENWTPFQYVMATPLLVAFEILLFLHLEDKYDDLKFVFLPLLAFEVAILVYNVRKCLTCMPRYEETMSEEPLLYTWVSIWMVSLIATITFTLLKSRRCIGDVAAWEWWNLSIIFGISECFGFLVTKWRNQSIHRSSHIPSSSSVGVRYRNEDSNRECDILDIGGYVMKIPFITFQIILFLSLEGTSASPKNIPIVVLFVPLFLLQGARVLFITYISLAKSILWIYSVGGPYGRSFARSSSSVFLRFFQHGRRLLGCWSVDEGSQEEQARLYTGEATGYNTFSPEVVKKMPKSDLVEEVRRLQAALSEQTDISKQEYEKLQDEKILCKVCIVEPIDVVLLPCKHRALCRFVFTPLWWLCHAIISRGRCSLPSPPMPHDENWTPFQYVMATPLLVAFEILLFLHLEDKYDVDLTFVFLPLLSFEVAILVVNLRKCLTRMPRNEETMSDEPLLYTWVSIWMVSFIAAITFTLVKSRAALELWDLSINFGIAELFGFLCAKWRKRSIHSDSHIPSSSSMGVRYGDEDSNIECGLLDIGGYVMKIPFITFQFILFLSLEGTPASPKKIPVLVLFVPLFLLQGAVVLSVTYISFSKSVLWIYNVGGPYGRYLARSSARVFLRFFQHCKRLLGCWSINEGSKEEQVRLHSGETTGYNTFSPKAALSEQTDSSQQEKNLCKVCFENPVNMVLLPCKHYVLCSTCCKKCKTCPICRELIKLRMPVYDA